MIHVCFALYDKIGTYSKFTGTAILSLFENTNSKVTVHLLHDNTLTNYNREKFIQIADRYGQILKFYNVEELYADKLAEIEKHFPKAKELHFSIAMFYRFFIPDLLLPQGVEKAIYLDSDIVVNLDIAEFWQIDLGDKPLGVVTEVSNGLPVKKFVLLVRDDVFKEEFYFNTGTLLMNLKVLHDEETSIQAGMKFISEYPNIFCLDQEVLNYCFATSALKLPIKFNFYVKWARLNGKLNVEEKILHYADERYGLGMDINDPYNRLFMDYFIKTPWVDDDTRAALSGTNLPSQKKCRVSVVIPLYNAEKYIGECLDSLLIQTFQDFEVIVVDDCSTDDGVKVVEEYTPKFNGRLKLVKLEKNSGGGGYVPRNTGLMLARGEYIQFLDADDMLLATALETLYMAASLYNADIVYTSSYYMLRALNNAYLYKDGIGQKMIYHLRDGTGRSIIDVQKEFTMDDPSKNLSRLLFDPNEGNFRASWTKFVRRDFILQNKIFFPNISNAGDFLWVINVYCHARRFLRISTPLYFYRFYNENSITRTVRTPQEQCNFWFSSFADFVKLLYELEKENEILAENPLYGLHALKGHFAWCLNRTKDARRELGNEEFYKVLHSEFVKNSNDPLAMLLSFLFSFIDNEIKINEYYSGIFNKFKRFFAARFDIKFMSEESDFQIVSVSDDKANVWKPDWLQKGGVGYQIQSHVGNMKLVAKANTEGKLHLTLKGVDVRNPDNKSKRIPYWVDYTKLIVNDKIIFGKLRPAWHDKPFDYTLDVKADEEINVQAEWLPHRSDVPKLASPPEKVEPIADKFLPYLTARLDAKFSTTTGGDLKILYVSDNKANVWKPEWFQKGGVGYQIQSHVGNIKLVAKATTEGKFHLALKGVDLRNPYDKSKRIPYWIDYTRFAVNDKIIFDAVTPAWHDEPFNYSLDVKADEEITLEVDWLPHWSEVAKIEPPQVAPPVVDKFLPYLTARLDAKFSTAAGGNFKILSISDGNAAVKKPDWFNKGGVGYVIQSLAGNMKLIAKATADGQLNLKLRGLWIPNPDDNSKLIPYWIDYTKLAINGKVILDKVTPAWHDAPFNYNLDVKADEEITLDVEWQPHMGEVAKIEPPPEKVAPPVVDKFLPYLTARLDAKLSTAAGGNFKIISISDDKAEIKKPDWLQKGGVGYVIQSLAGEMKLVAKATANGQLNLKLRSLWIPDPDDSSKLIPYWIDYTKLVINGEVILDKVTPAWHDEPFIYNLDVKANEEIFLDVEWLPHMGEVAKIAPPPEKVAPPVVDKFLPYLTARLDAKFSTAAGGDFQILSVSDDKAEIKKPDWLQKGGVGYVIQSLAGEMKLIAKATANGQLNLKLRSLWIPDPDDSSKLIPYWIDYTKLTINGEVILDDVTPAWHDEPFIYTLDVKANEEIFLDVEWLPHMGEVPKIAPLPPEKVEPPVNKFSIQQRTARLDAKLTTEEGGDFQILSVSDDKADVKKPDWLNKGGVGYVIQSLAGEMKLVAKATANGQLNLKLRSLWIPDPDDSSKLIPYWIDYTKLIVNSETIFDETTPAWHDEPFIYKLDVKADEEITLQVEWQPHRGEVPKIEPSPQVEPPVNKFSIQQRTARLDAKLTTEEGGDFQILSVSDDKAEIKKPDWFNKGGIGYVIQSLAGEMKLIAKATSNGQLNLKLRGLWIPDPDDKSKLIPYWIDYTKLIVNGKTILDKTTPAWHDEPFIYILDVKSDEEITLQVEWLPHKSDA